VQWRGRQRTDGVVDLVRRWQLLSTVALALIAIALFAMLALFTRVYGPDVRERIDAVSTLRASHVAMLDQQAGLRGYAATGDDRFLEAYERGRAALDQQDRATDALIGDERPDLVLAVRVAQGAWLDQWVPRALDAGREGGLEGDAGEDLLLDGKMRFDRYGEAHATLLEQVLEDRQDALDRQDDAVTRTALAALVLAVGAGVLSAVQGQRLRRQLSTSMADLQRRLDRLREGDLSVGPDDRGTAPAELEQVHAGLDAATAELARGRQALLDEGDRTATHNRQLGQVLRFAREVAGSLNLRYVLRGLCTAAAAIAAADRVVVWVRAEAGDELDPVADSTGPSLAPLGLEPLPVGEGTVGRVARFGRAHGLADDLDADADAEAGEGDGLVAVPMVVGAEVVGVLELHVSDPAALAGSTGGVLEALAIQAATAVSAARLHEQTTVLAMTDALTRLPNRRRLEGDLAKEVGISQRYARPLAFAMADVDHFKDYNDELGHQAADVALQSLAQLLAGSVRTGDTVYRYGGEEIAILMRETDGGSAEQVADRLRRIVEHHFAAPGQPRAVTVSIGVAVMPAHATNAEALVAAADTALYEAKRGGRNQVRLAGV
jgi:diguanylate cyclase (GGDEF)-like protein